MLVSVVVPVYNAEDKIQYTIESILSQSYTKFELILVDDGSTDNSGIICDDISRINNKVKVIHQKNAGPSAARNSGISASRGDYITFVDADDSVDQDWLSLLIDAAGSSKADLIVTGYKGVEILNGHKSYRHIRRPNSSLKLISGHKVVLETTFTLIDDSLFNPLWNKLYKADIIRKHNLKLSTKYDLGEDFLFNIHYIEKCKSIYILDATPYNYLLNLSGLTHRYKKDKFEALRGVTLEFREFLSRGNGSLDYYYQRLVRNCFSSFMELFHSNCSMSLREKASEIRKIKEETIVQEMVSIYRPKSCKQRFILSILGWRNIYCILVMAKFFHFKKFVIGKR